MTENKPTHDNSKDSKKKQHLYAIIEIFRNLAYKFGISGEKLNKDGSSPRANSQVNKLNKRTGKETFKAEILETDIEDRNEALQKEKDVTEKFQDEHGDEMPGGQQRPDKRKNKNNK